MERRLAALARGQTMERPGACPGPRASRWSAEYRHPLPGLHPIAAYKTDTRATRLAELKAQLQALSEEGGFTAPGSPEREALLERWAPIHAAVVALADELSGD
jgi:hypothetical protein